MRRLTMPMSSGDRLDRGVIAECFSWSHLPWLRIYGVPKSSDRDFEARSLHGPPSDIQENTGRGCPQKAEPIIRINSLIKGFIRVQFSGFSKDFLGIR